MMNATAMTCSKGILYVKVSHYILFHNVRGCGCHAENALDVW